MSDPIQLKSKKKRKTADSEMADQFKVAARGKIQAGGAGARPKRIKRLTDIDIMALDYFSGPSYAWADNKKAGGKHSSAILGPGCLRSENSDADPNLPSAMKHAKTEYPDEDFVAGHLLNSALGGNGKDARNITILTSSGNSSHKGFDNPIKTAVAELKKAYVAMNNLGIDVSKLKYGIRVDIEIDEDCWGDHYPDNCISAGLTCTAGVSKEPDVEALLNAKFPDEDDRRTGWRSNLAVANAAVAKVADWVDVAEAAGDIHNPQTA
jgi:hypothetical protein